MARMPINVANLWASVIPEAFPKPATEETGGPKVRNIYSFDALMRVKALPDKEADFEMIGELGTDMADAAIEVAESTDDQAERDQRTKAVIKEVEAIYQAKY